MSRTTNRQNFLRAGALVAAGLLVAGLSSPAAAGKPDHAGPPPSDGGSTDTSGGIRITEFGTVGVAVPATPDTPNYYVVADTAFALTVEFVNGGGKPQPLSKSEPVSIALTVAQGDTALQTAPNQTVPAGATTFTFTGNFTAAAADTVVKITAETNPVASVLSDPFDVLIDSSSNNRIALNDDGTCADTCARLVPPSTGFENGTPTLLSRGKCNENPCEGGKFVQALAAFDEGSGSPADPATLIVTCDKEICGVGSIQQNNLMVQIRPTDTPSPAPECPAKGVVGAGQEFCVDYVQSQRDGSGDTHLYLLFIIDAKVRWM